MDFWENGSIQKYRNNIQAISPFDDNLEFYLDYAKGPEKYRPDYYFESIPKSLYGSITRFGLAGVLPTDLDYVAGRLFCLTQRLMLGSGAFFLALVLVREPTIALVCGSLACFGLPTLWNPMRWTDWFSMAYPTTLALAISLWSCVFFCRGKNLSGGIVASLAVLVHPLVGFFSALIGSAWAFVFPVHPLQETRSTIANILDRLRGSMFCLLVPGCAFLCMAIPSFSLSAKNQMSTAEYMDLFRLANHYLPWWRWEESALVYRLGSGFLPMCMGAGTLCLSKSLKERAVGILYLAFSLVSLLQYGISFELNNVSGCLLAFPRIMSILDYVILPFLLLDFQRQIPSQVSEKNRFLAVLTFGAALAFLGSEKWAKALFGIYFLVRLSQSFRQTKPCHI